ncbi:MAG: hypothetical protein WBE91_17940 [Steroidobacteraceae bacterium]
MIAEPRPAGVDTRAPAVDLTCERWLIRRLGDHGRRIEDGVTDVTVRRERIRAAILEGGLGAVVAGRGVSGKPEAYAQVFARLYGEALEAHVSGRGAV